jgi:hypothetical protein
VNVDKMRHQLDRTAPKLPPMTVGQMREQIRAEGVAAAAMLDGYIAGQLAEQVKRLNAADTNPPPWLRRT